MIKHRVKHHLYQGRKEFDAWELACLMAGIEPMSIDRETLATVPDVRSLLCLIEKAYQNALWCCRALCAGGTVFNRDAKTPEEAYVEFGVSSEPSCLPSVQLWDAHHYAVKEGNGIDEHTEVLLNTSKPTFHLDDVEKWLELIGWQGKQHLIQHKDSIKMTITTRERETLLKLVIGMAIKGYAYDPLAAKNAAVPEIVKDLTDLGLTISDETVRKYLSEAQKAVLPGGTHKS